MNDEDAAPTLRVPIISTGQLVIMTCATFDAMTRAIETVRQVSIENMDQKDAQTFNRTLAIAAAADPNARVHDLLKQLLEGEV